LGGVVANAAHMITASVCRRLNAAGDAPKNRSSCHLTPVISGLVHPRLSRPQPARRMGDHGPAEAAGAGNGGHDRREASVTALAAEAGACFSE
jgi:hypothetical protein